MATISYRHKIRTAACMRERRQWEKGMSILAKQKGRGDKTIEKEERKSATRPDWKAVQEIESFTMVSTGSEKYWISKILRIRLLEATYTWKLIGYPLDMALWLLLGVFIAELGVGAHLLPILDKTTFCSFPTTLTAFVPRSWLVQFMVFIISWLPAEFRFLDVPYD